MEIKKREISNFRPTREEIKEKTKAFLARGGVIKKLKAQTLSYCYSLESNFLIDPKWNIEGKIGSFRQMINRLTDNYRRGSNEKF